jgi:hypothetical protein
VLDCPSAATALPTTKTNPSHLRTHAVCLSSSNAFSQAGIHYGHLDPKTWPTGSVSGQLTETTAGGRGRWRAFVNTIMNLRVPWKMGNFLTSSVHYQVLKELAAAWSYIRAVKPVIPRSEPCNQSLALTPCYSLRVVIFQFIEVLSALFSEYLTWKHIRLPAKNKGFWTLSIVC